MQSVVSDVVFINRCETVVIDDMDDSVCSSDKLQRLIYMLHLIIMGMRLAVRSNDAVDTELTVVGFVAKVTTVEEYAVFFYSLVHPVPNGGTNDTGVGINDVPVLLQIATGIAHGVGIFAHHKGLVAHFLCLAIQFIGIEIAVVPDIGIAAVAVVEGRTGGVECLHLMVHGLDVGALGTLVAQTPKDDAGVVEVALHQ